MIHILGIGHVVCWLAGLFYFDFEVNRSGMFHDKNIDISMIFPASEEEWLHFDQI